MRPNELKSLISSRFKAGIKRALHVVGSPGVGKTQIAAQAARELGVGFKVIHAPLMQPEDYGFPSISSDRSDVNFIVSKSKFPLVGSDCEETGIFLIDELPQADVSGQKILANLLQEREIHGHKLKAGWMIITTGNRATDRAGASRLLSHLQNRVTEMDLEISVDDWTQWALSNNVAMEVIAFIRFRPELLNNFDAQQQINATPRAWAEGVAAQLGAIDPAHEFAAFKGDVGEGAAAEFCAFLKIFRKLPSPDAILLNPKGAEVPTDPATLYALCGALASRTTGDNFGRIMEYVGRMPAEFSVLFVRDATRCRKPAQAKPCGECSNCGVTATKDFITWAAGAGSKILA